MSVFKIQQPGIKAQADEEGNSIATDTNPQNLRDKEVIDEITGKSSQQSAENLSMGANAAVINTPPGEQETGQDLGVLGEMAAEGTPEEPVIPKEKAGILIKIDGPVGRVFTDALNTVLANESYMTMMPDAPESEGEDHRQIATQVYCWKADELLVEDVVAITNDIVKHTDRDYVIIAETAGTVSKNLALMNDLCRFKNVKVCFSQQAGLDEILGKLA